MVGTGPNIFTIQGSGLAEHFLGAGKEFMSELGNNFELELSEYWPVTQLEHKGTAMIKIKPLWLTVLNLEPTPYPQTVWKGYYKIRP